MPPIVLPPIGPYLRDRSQAAALNYIDSIAEVGPTALLHAALQNLPAGMYSACERRALLNGVGDWLLQIDVLAGRQCIHRHGDVPMVGRGDDHRVYVFLEHLMIIKVCGRQPIGPFFHLIASRRVHVTYGNDLERAGLIGGVEQPAHAAAGPNDPDADGVIGAQGSA